MKPISILLFVVACCCSSFCHAQITVNATGGTLTASYTTLKTAFDAISFGVHQGQVEVLINGNVTETIGAELVASGGTANYSRVTIMPTTACTISGNLAKPLIYLRGADSVRIDGRIGGTGNTASLTIENTYTSTFSALIGGIRLDSMAQFDTVMYVNFKTSATSLLVGDWTTNVFVDHNDMSWVNSVRQYAGIVAGGAEHLITNNTIHDFSAYGLNIAAALSTPLSNIVVKDNSIYETSATATTATYLSASGPGHIIRRNYIGGSAPFAGGTPAQHTTVTGINSGGLSAQIDSNVVTNIKANTFTGISASAGAIGMNEGNIIGSTTDTGAVRASTINGIQISAVTVKCHNNYIGGLAATYRLRGIYGVTAGSGPDSLSIFNNTIGGSLATCLKIDGGTGGADSLMGIQLINAKGSIQQNTISHLYHYNSSQYTSMTAGINCGAKGDVLISGNQISELHSVKTQVMAGIMLRNSTTNAGTRIVSGNTISALSTSFHASASAATVCGICSNTNQGTNVIYNNTISDLSDTSTAATNASFSGIYLGHDLPNAAIQIIRKNTISDLTSTSSHASSVTSGITTMVDYAGTVTIDSNDIGFITSASSRTSTTNGVATQGIGALNPKKGTISANVIHDIANLSAAATTITGINSRYTLNVEPLVIKANRMYNLDNANSVNGSVVGVIAAGSGGAAGNGTGTLTIVNNMMTLTPMSNTKVYGIWNSLPGTLLNTWYNSVYLGGTSSGNNTSSAFTRVDYAYTGIDLRNNLLINERGGGTEGHYAIVNDNLLPGAGWTTSNYNDIYTSNPATLASWSGADLDLATYRTTTLKDSCSVSQIVDFADVPNGDLHLQNTATNETLRAIAIAEVPDDFDGDLRHPTPAIGADEIVVATTAPTISAAGSTSFCEGDSVVLSASTSSDIQWYRNGTAIAGATSDMLTVYETGDYRVVYADLCFADSSNIIPVSVTHIDSTVYEVGQSQVAASAGSYQWMYCDNGLVPIPGATSQSYTPVQNGNYAVVISVNGCSDTSECINVSYLSVGEETLQSARVFPNPGGNNITLSLPGIAENVSVTIVNALGQEVLREQHAAVPLIEVNSEQLSKGLYFIRLQTKSSSTTVKWVKAQ